MMSCTRTIYQRLRSVLASLALGITFVSLTVTAALAQVIDATGAAKLKADIERALERREAGFHAQYDGAKLNHDGEVTVTPSGSYYAVQLPHLSITGPMGGTIDIGVIKLNAVPAGPDAWRVTMAIPTPLTGFDATGVPRITFSIGKQQFAGVWHAGFDNYPELDMNWSDIKLNINDVNGKLDISIGNIRGNTKLTDQGGYKYSGPYDYVIEDMDFIATPSQSRPPSTGSIARIHINGSVQGVDMKRVSDFQRSMEDRVNEMGRNQGTPNPQVTKDIMNELLDYLVSFADGFDSQVAIEGISLRMTPKNIPAQGPVDLQLAKIGFGMNMKDMSSDKLSMGINYGIEGINIVPTPPEAVNFLPASFVFNVALENMPHKFISNMAKDQVGKQIDAQSGQSSGQPNYLQAIEELKQEMANSGAVIRMDGTRLNAGMLEALLNGEIRANSNAVMGATMNMNLLLSGMDKIVSMISQPGTPPQIQQQAMMALNMIQSMGKPETAADGSVKYRFDLQLTENGQALLNGNPMPIGGAMMGGPGIGGPGGGTQGGMPMVP